MIFGIRTAPTLDFQPTLFYIDGPDPENKRAKESFRVVVDQDGNIESMGKSNKRGQWIWWERDKLDGRFYLAPESTNRRSKAQRSPIEVAGIPYLGIPGIDEEHQIQLLAQGIDVAATQAAVEQLFQSRSPQLPTTVFVYKS